MINTGRAEGSARLEELTPGVSVQGVTADGPVTVVAVSWHGTQAVTLTYREAGGQVAERLLFRADEPQLVVSGAARRWTFDVDGRVFRLVSEARRIQLAHLFDPKLAVHLSVLEPLPHQIEAVYGEMIPRQPLRFALCDDPGAGKTIMAGLYIKELALRGDLVRCLVVAPGGLVTQWQDELAEKFGLRFVILTREGIEASVIQNPFAEQDLLIARLDHLSRNEDLQDRLAATDWDLIVVDEAHRMAAHWFGQEVRETKRYRLGRLLSRVCRHFLLMTATPHAGKEEDFQLFMALLDPDRFEGMGRSGLGAGVQLDTTDLMRRMIKEKLLRFDGRPLFPERIASTVAYPLSELEARLYEVVTAYVSEEMNRAARLADEGEGRRGNRVGFAMTVLQRRLASSPEAIYQSIVRRRHRLEDDLAEQRALAAQRRSAVGRFAGRLVDELDADDDPDSYDDLSDDELEEVEEELAGGASAAATVAELEVEIATLVRLESLAAQVRSAGTDRKWGEFTALLDEISAPTARGVSSRKLIVFTEHRDTLNYLVGRLRALLGRPEAVVAMHGGTKREDRRAIQETFATDPECRILVGTDAAGEGINLQRAHLLINYDLPWNPNRIEQRFGRIHRIGQEEVCHMWNLVAEDTREGQVYLTLLAKLDEQRAALGGQVFDVLGEAFRGRPLRELLIEAIRYGDRPDVRARLDLVIDETVGDGLADLVERHALSTDLLEHADLERLRAEMDEAAARKLQPHFIREFFVNAFSDLGGRISEREPHRYQIAHVPSDLRDRGRRTTGGTPVVARYERVCFDKPELHLPGRPPAELLAPGHPLLDATVELTLDRHPGVLTQGAVLIAPADDRDTPRVLVYLEHVIVDGRTDRHGGPWVVSRRFEFVELDLSGEARPAGPAPYLDCRPPTADELGLIAPLLGGDWLAKDLEGMALDVAVTQAVPAHLAEMRSKVVDRVRRVRAAVHERLTQEILYWDQRANELAEQADAGRQPRINPERARQRANDLADRRRRRMAELDKEEQLQALPPVVVGAALVVPGNVLDRLSHNEPSPPRPPTRETKRIERLAVEAVMAEERIAGRQPEEMPYANPGFDIRSREPDGHLRFLEVKGRVAGAESVMITRNEILTGLNTDRWILALVLIGPDNTTQVRYLHHPFRGRIDDLGFTETSRTFPWDQLWSVAGAPA